MAQDTPQKFSLWTLTAMVVGSMVGAGIFSLPQAFGRATGPFGALVAWAIAGVGMLMLALVFQTLSRRKPDLDAGIYAYAKTGFGNYPEYDDAPGAERGEVLRDERLADVECLVQVLDGAFAADQLLEQADARRMGEGAKELALRFLQWRGHIAISLYA